MSCFFLFPEQQFNAMQRTEVDCIILLCLTSQSKGRKEKSERIKEEEEEGKKGRGRKGNERKMKWGSLGV